MARYKNERNSVLPRFITVVLVLALGVGTAFWFNSCLDNKNNTGIDNTGDGTSDTTSDGGETSNPNQDTEPVTPISYEERVGKNYTIDITQYLEFIEPENKFEYVFLVNPSHTLASDYVPEDLTDCGYTRQDGREVQKMRLAAAKALQAFLGEGKHYGVTNVTVTSAYRSYSYQNYLFNMYFDRDWATGRFATKEECEKYTLSYSTKPGTSEHQSGLCCDMHNMPSAQVGFANTEEAQWLADNCHRFGFILRYPDGKTDITGITYEPWHFRFVGRDAATEMYELGLTLEEYVQKYTNTITSKD